MQIANFNITSFDFGSFRLDGGAMFGSVPKAIWDQKLKADADNCIRLVTRSLLLTREDRKILVDLGNGHKWNKKMNAIFDFKNTADNDLPFKANEISDVILTHLHFDHVGGISRLNSDGNPEAVYPEATFYVQRKNFELAQKPNQRERASYLDENISVLAQAKLELLDGETEILPGLKVCPSNGHTEGLQYVAIKDNKKTLYYPSDLLPTARHLHIPYHMGYDMNATKLLEEKQLLLEQAVSEEAIIVFQHDPDTPAATITKDSRGRFVIKERVDLASDVRE